MNPTVQAAIDAITKVDTDLTAANTAVQTAAELHTQDQQTIQDLQAKLAKAQPTPSPQVAYPTLQVFQPTIVSGLERMPNWVQPSNTGDTGGGNPKVHGTYTITPRSDGWTDFSIKPGYDYNNFYFYRDLGAHPEAAHFAWQAKVMFPTDADLAACLAWEWELEQCIAGDTFNMGWQCLLKQQGTVPAGGWRYFDKVNQKWIDSGLRSDPKIFAGAKTVSVVAEYMKPDPDSVTHVALTINGVRNVVNKNNPPGRKSWSVTTKYLHYAVQIDPVKSMPCTMRVQSMVGMYL